MGKKKARFIPHKRKDNNNKNSNSQDRLKELIRALKTKEIDPILWAMHFPNSIDRKVPTCRDCEDYKVGVCKGGTDPIECFKNKKAETTFGGFEEHEDIEGLLEDKIIEELEKRT